MQAEILRHFAPLDAEFGLWMDGELCDNTTLIPRVETLLNGPLGHQHAQAIAAVFERSDESGQFETWLNEYLKLYNT